MNIRMILALLLLPLAVASQTVSLDSGATLPFNISARGVWYEDTSATLTVNQLADKPFMPVTGPNFRVPFSDAAFWFKYTLQNNISEQEQWYLEWSSPVVERVECYVPQSDGSYKIQEAGTLVAHKGLIDSPNFLLNLPVGQEKTIYFRIKSQRGHRADVFIYEAPTFFARQIEYTRTDSFFNGLVIIRLFYVLLLAIFAVRETAFRAYSFMLVLRSLAFWGIKSSLGSFFTNNPTLATFINFTSYHLVPIGYVLVVKALLPVHRFPVFVRYVLNGIIVLVVLLSVAMAADYRWYWLLASQYLSIFSQSIILVLYAVATLRRYPINWYYSAPFLLGMGSFFFLLLSAVGLINAGWVFTVANFLFISEIFVFGVFLGKIIINFEQAKTVSQKQLLFNQQQAAKLQELDILKSNFFANISHEFRTPLTLLVGPLDDFRKKYPAENLIPVMQRNARRLQSLISQLLDLSKLEAGRLVPHMLRDDLAAYLRPMFASFESLAQSRNINFNYEQSHEHREAYFDPDLLEKIVTNLLSNAFKFTPEGGRVYVRVDYSDKTLVLKVQDYGIGIEPTRLLHIFDRFYQVEPNGQRSDEGTGIGLSLVQEIVEVLHGKIWAESEPGQGSTFTVRLPVDADTWADFLTTAPPRYNPVPAAISPGLEPASDAVLPVPSQPAVQPELPLLLLVEDNPDLRTYMRTIFGQGYRVLEATDGQDGLNQAFEHIPDLVVCDVMMPRLHGFAFCKTLKTDLRTSHIPVVMLTAKAALEDRLEGLEMGADDYLTKPFNRDELLIRVQNLLKQRNLLRQKYGQLLAEPSASFADQELSKPDLEFLQRAMAVVEEHMADNSFNAEEFCKIMKLGRTQMHRKLKSLTNQSSTEFMRAMRIRRAADLLKKQKATVSEVAYQVGFESLSYFSKTFQEQMGASPSEWLAGHS